jgi:diacylglycerol kinase (ATP)
MNKRSGRFSLLSRLRSFHYAFRGIGWAFRQEHNLWIHIVAAAAAIALAFLLHVSSLEWLVIVLVIAGVFSAELFNSAMEGLADLYSPDFNERAGRIKDMAAGAVLITALGALVAGLIIFIPKLLALL